MKYLYLFTLEIVPLEIGRAYDDLPSHLTLMSRFWSDLSPNEVTNLVRPLFDTEPVHLRFGETVELGPKRLLVHVVDSPDETKLHERLMQLLDTTNVEYQYPEFIGVNHKAHVTTRVGVQFRAGETLLTTNAYLIEVVDAERIVRSRLELKGITR